jgi:hypothetical protein
VDESTITDGAESALESSPSSPRTTALKSSGPATIVKTTSHPANAAGLSTTVAPSSSNGSALARVRL